MHHNRLIKIRRFEFQPSSNDLDCTEYNQGSQGRVLGRRSARPYVLRPANRASILSWFVFVSTRGQERVFDAGT
jgi:hypothetical protein